MKIVSTRRSENSLDSSWAPSAGGMILTRKARQIPTGARWREKKKSARCPHRIAWYRCFGIFCSVFFGILQNWNIRETRMARQKTFMMCLFFFHKHFMLFLLFIRGSGTEENATKGEGETRGEDEIISWPYQRHKRLRAHSIVSYAFAHIFYDVDVAASFCFREPVEKLTRGRREITIIIRREFRVASSQLWSACRIAYAAQINSPRSTRFGPAPAKCWRYLRDIKMQFFTSRHHGMSIGSGQRCRLLRRCVNLQINNIKHEISRGLVRLELLARYKFLLIVRLFGAQQFASWWRNVPSTALSTSLFCALLSSFELLKTGICNFRARWPRPKGGRDRAKEVLNQLDDGFLNWFSPPLRCPAVFVLNSSGAGGENSHE